MNHDERTALNQIFDSLTFADAVLEMLIPEDAFRKIVETIPVNEPLKELA